MKKLIEILAGLILLLLPVCAWILNFWEFGDAALMVFKGGLVWGLILIGIVLLVVGISDLKN